MPIYEYQCSDCENLFEVFKNITDNNGSKCPKCSSEKVKRLISHSGFILKGSGWYVTDYPSESRKKGMASEGTTSKSSTIKPSTTSTTSTPTTSTSTVDSKPKTAA